MIHIYYIVFFPLHFVHHPRFVCTCSLLRNQISGVFHPPQNRCKTDCRFPLPTSQTGPTETPEPEIDDFKTSNLCNPEQSNKYQINVYIHQKLEKTYYKQYVYIYIFIFIYTYISCAYVEIKIKFLDALKIEHFLHSITP